MGEVLSQQERLLKAAVAYFQEKMYQNQARYDLIAPTPRSILRCRTQTRSGPAGLHFHRWGEGRLMHLSNGHRLLANRAESLDEQEAL